MFELVDKPFMNEQMRSEIGDIIAAQERATEMGGILVTEYDKYFLPPGGIGRCQAQLLPPQPQQRFAL